MEVEKYVEIYKKALGLGVGSEVAIAIMQEMGKDSRTPHFENNQPVTQQIKSFAGVKQIEPATPKQIDYINNLKEQKLIKTEIDPKKITKEEAKVLIKEVIDRLPARKARSENENKRNM